jgi:hypothetical protein
LGEELAIPGTGELVDLSDVPAVVGALEALRDYESLLRETKATLTRAIVEYATDQGVRSVELPDGGRAEISAPSESVYDPYVLTEKLREAGMPEERIDELIEETVTHRVRAGEAKKAAKANPAYAEAVAASRSEQAKSQYVSIKRKR